MASNTRIEDEFKLPLRLWLKKKINQGTFKGLEWIDQQEQIFKIPWTQKGHPGWEEHYEIFREWAKHRGKYNEKSPPDDNRLKGNFRCVLNKSEDFREIKEESITNQQTGNCKVYQILPSSLVKATKAKKRKSQSKVSDSQSTSSPTSKLKKYAVDDTTNYNPSPQSSDAPIQISSSEPIQSVVLIQTEVINHEQNISVITSSDNNSDIIQLQTDDPFFCSPCSEQETTASQILYENTDFNSNQILPAIDPEDINHILVQSNHLQIPALRKEDEFLQPNILMSLQQPQTVDRLQEFLSKSKRSENELAAFAISLSYGEKTIVCQKAMDLSQPRRILYGNAADQNVAIAASEIHLDDFNLATWEFPTYSGKDVKIRESLRLADQGIVLSAENNGVLYGKRLCQSRVWVLHDTEEPKKMIRKEKTELFSYVKYIEKLLSDQHSQASWKIELLIGEKPPTANLHLVSIVIEPMLAPLVENFFSQENNSSSLCYSSEASMDKVIRLFNKQSLLNINTDL